MFGVLPHPVTGASVCLHRSCFTAPADDWFLPSLSVSLPLRLFATLCLPCSLSHEAMQFAVAFVNNAVAIKSLLRSSTAAALPLCADQRRTGL